MKNLKESLFDKNLTTSELPIEKLIKGTRNLWKRTRIPLGELFTYYFSSLDDIKMVAKYKWNKYSEEQIEYLYNLYLWEDKLLVDQNTPIFQAAPWNLREFRSNESYKNAINWLKFGYFHEGTSWNDKMYANELDIPWRIWDNVKSDWIMWKEKDSICLLYNRNDISKEDQLLVKYLQLNQNHHYKKTSLGF